MFPLDGVGKEWLASGGLASVVYLEPHFDELKAIAIVTRHCKAEREEDGGPEQRQLEPGQQLVASSGQPTASRVSGAAPQSVRRLVIGCAASDRELSVCVVDDHQTSRSNSKLLRQPRLDDDLQEVAVDFADSLGKWRKHISTCLKWDEDDEFTIDDVDGPLQRDDFSH